jgi:hypothetical protein
MADDGHLLVAGLEMIMDAKVAQRQEVHQLRKDRASGVHMPTPQGKEKAEGYTRVEIDSRQKTP